MPDSSLRIRGTRPVRTGAKATAISRRDKVKTESLRTFACYVLPMHLFRKAVLTMKFLCNRNQGCLCLELLESQHQNLVHFAPPLGVEPGSCNVRGPNPPPRKLRETRSTCIFPFLVTTRYTSGVDSAPSLLPGAQSVNVAPLGVFTVKLMTHPVS